MTLIKIEVNMKKMNRFPVEKVPEQIDTILKPHHLEWAYGNYYRVEAGYDVEIAVQGAMEALQKTSWLKGALLIQVVRLVVKRKLDAINVEAMSPPLEDKLEKARKLFHNKKISENKLAYPNPIVIDENNKLLDGYTTYLLMREYGLNEAVCLLIKEEYKKKNDCK